VGQEISVVKIPLRYVLNLNNIGNGSPKGKGKVGIELFHQRHLLHLLVVSLLAQVGQRGVDFQTMGGPMLGVGLTTEINKWDMARA
jgi:hypothetical protein